MIKYQIGTFWGSNTTWLIAKIVQHYVYLNGEMKIRSTSQNRKRCSVILSLSLSLSYYTLFAYYIHVSPESKNIHPHVNISSSNLKLPHTRLIV
jgi:hypothetical protein